jgi:hypothetical protein
LRKRAGAARIARWRWWMCGFNAPRLLRRLSPLVGNVSKRAWLRQIYEFPASPCRGFEGRSPLQGGRSP